MSMEVLDALIRIRRALARGVAASFKGEVGARQTALLRELKSLGSASQATLARATVSDPSLVVRMIDNLERRGLVVRTISKSDRREKIVRLTPKGRRAVVPLDATLAKLADAAVQQLSPEEQQQFIALSEKIMQGLAQLAEAPPEPGKTKEVKRGR